MFLVAKDTAALLALYHTNPGSGRVPAAEPIVMKVPFNPFLMRTRAVVVNCRRATSPGLRKSTLQKFGSAEQISAPSNLHTWLLGSYLYGSSLVLVDVSGQTQDENQATSFELEYPTQIRNRRFEGGGRAPGSTMREISGVKAVNDLPDPD
ncbi:hypothetical protein N7466_009788 [Penicillium verhagenii]|uniref:uncharacterized protein n=1 Tax=Penicillium verhagenii TaxID=1562060 RepID=UPI002545178A|nr:uncharacterized protein N7466_009788 [Penicillium verhagenii]KAJ5921462.1 hypothetical protein N7466_009788 [Penicillium verhagenii]